MFTGIIEELGEIVGKEDLPEAARLRIRGPLVSSDARHGDSIAVNGVCLTVVRCFDSGEFTADVMQETLLRSTLQKLDPGSVVNLERAVLPTTRLGGHIVQGHVDGTGQVLGRSPSDFWEEVWISLPRELARFVAEKGSVAIDGVSLTVSALAHDASGHSLRVSLIPTTLSATTLGRADVGSAVNLEVDVVAKYLDRLTLH
ncbi:riboflavin synthase alpha chain [Rhodococcus sp. SMB37]|uniref:riboflavin synthase n=1 Tax=Rhodococcus sp. SMB37 TaxID=2512213 RepID=UPI001044523D|nr:riboflavin synthase [Rhodococcus sp. SMB37]TCN55866.1 riboflavin synthase alpha chain [Rhodococcus sp. SMB37]